MDVMTPVFLNAHYKTQSLTPGYKSEYDLYDIEIIIQQQDPYADREAEFRIELRRSLFFLFSLYNETFKNMQYIGDIQDT